MAKYYLTVNGKPGFMNPVEWARFQFKDYKPHDLQSIDDFCMFFHDESGIKEHLLEVADDDYNREIISEMPNFKNQLNIRYINNKAIRTLSYGLPYKKDKKYFDYEYLRARLQSLRNNAAFLSRLASKFRGAPIQDANIALFQNVAECLKMGISYHDEDRFYKAMDNFIKIILFEYDKKNHEYKTDENNSLVYQWRQLHDLAMFVKNYDQKQSEPSKLEKTKQESVKAYDIPPRKLFVPSKQISFFDS